MGRAASWTPLLLRAPCLRLEDTSCVTAGATVASAGQQKPPETLVTKVRTARVVAWLLQTCCVWELQTLINLHKLSCNYAVLMAVQLPMLVSAVTIVQEGEPEASEPGDRGDSTTFSVLLSWLPATRVSKNGALPLSPLTPVPVPVATCANELPGAQLTALPDADADMAVPAGVGVHRCSGTSTSSSSCNTRR